MTKLSKYKECGGLNVSVTGKLIYLMLIELADENGEIIIPQRKISDALHISKGTVRRNLRRLQGGGYINIFPQHRSDDGSRAANKYVIR